MGYIARNKERCSDRATGYPGKKGQPVAACVRRTASLSVMAMMVAMVMMMVFKGLRGRNERHG
jgi:hypothetical protein